MPNSTPLERTRLAACLAALLAVGACSGSSSEPAAAPATPTNAPLERGEAEAPEHQQFAYFAGGCFWGVEHFLEQMDGVFEVDSGYMGGTKDNPTYDDVLTHTTGHLETVRVRFDPSKVSYRALAKRFFEIHDPTQRDGQGPDIGNQYLSAVFYVDDDQKRDTEALIGLLEERGYNVATMVKPADEFWKAEGHHQDYYARTGKTPYCHARVRRFDD